MLTYATAATFSALTYTSFLSGGSSYGETRGTTNTDIDSVLDVSTLTFSRNQQQVINSTLAIEYTRRATSYQENSSSSGTSVSSYNPSTASDTYPSASDSTGGTTASGSTTYTLHVSVSGSYSETYSSHRESLEGNTTYARSTGISRETAQSTGSSWDTGMTGSTTSGSQSTTSIPDSYTTSGTKTGTPSTSSGSVMATSSSARSVSGTVSETHRSTATYGYRTTTFTSSNENCVRYTTTSETGEDTDATPTTTTGTWGTDYTAVSHDITTTSVRTETDGHLTVEADDTRQKTESYTYLSGTATETGTRAASSFTQTTSAHHMVSDTVYLLSDGGSKFLLGHMMWSMSTAGTADSFTAKFTDLYTPSVADSFTISHFQKFSTASLAVPIHTLVRQTASSTTAVLTGTGTGTGSVSTTTITTATDGYTTSSSSSHGNSWLLGAISTSLSTWSNTSTTFSSTIFTCEGFISGYESTGNGAFTTSTTTSGWPATSSSGSHTAWAASYTTTATKHSRSITADEVLRNASISTTVTGTYTGRSLLGLSRHTTSRLISEVVTVTSTAWHSGLGASNYTSTFSTDNSDDGSVSSVATGISASHNYTLSTSRSLVADVQSTRYTPPVGNECWMKAHARGWVGFCGTFTQTAADAYLTTSSGLAAGTVFPDCFAAILLGGEDAYQGARRTIVPCNSTTGITLQGVGMQQSSLISEPSAVVQTVSVAATWSSTTATGTASSDTVVTTQAATHTAGMLTALTGDFWTSHTVTMDSNDANIGRNGPHASMGGYVAGDNRSGTQEVRIAAGAASWTRFTSGVSDVTGVSGATSGTAESVSFTVPQGAAVRIAAEPIYTVTWVSGTSQNHAISTSPHQDF